MNNLYEIDLLPVSDYESLEECQECEGVYNNGDYILDQLNNGNWTDGVKNMLEIYVTPNELADFITDKVEEGLIDGGFFDRSAIATISNIYYNLRNEK